MSYDYDESTYKEDLFIDKYNLDLEWEKQAMLFVKWAERWAAAVERRDRAKQFVEVVKAELYGKIRSNPELYDLKPNATEGAVNSYIIRTRKYKKAFDGFLESTKQVNILASAKEAMNHKKKALEYVSQLMLGGFFASPSIKPEAREKVEQQKNLEVRKQLKNSKRMQGVSQNESMDS